MNAFFRLHDYDVYIYTSISMHYGVNKWFVKSEKELLSIFTEYS